MARRDSAGSSFKLGAVVANESGVSPQPSDTPNTLSDWYKRFASEWELPAGAHLADDGADFFVIVEEVYRPSGGGDAHTAPHLVCRVRQENRPILVPLHKLELQSDSSIALLASKYCRWLEKRA